MPGVGDVVLFGTSDYAMRIWVKPDQLARLGLTVADLVDAIQKQNTVNPSGKIGGEPAPAGQEFTYSVRAQGRLVTAEEFGNIVVRADPSGAQIRLKDVARIELGALNYNQRGRLNGKPAAIIAIYQIPGSNALQVAAGLKATMEQAKTRFPQDLDFNDLARHHARRVRGHPRDRAHALEAMVLVILVVFLFLQSWRATLDPADHRAGLAGRRLRRLPAARLLDQHALAVRAGARDRTGRRRRDRRGRGRTAPHRARHVAARGHEPRDEGGGAGR